MPLLGENLDDIKYYFVHLLEACKIVHRGSLRCCDATSNIRFPFFFDIQSQEAICHRFLSKGAPEIKVYGAMRFNPEEAPATEWRPFGSFYFIIPQVGFTPKHATFRYLSFYIIFLSFQCWEH